MDIAIGEYKEETKTVSVSFQHNDVTHTREVNAVLTEDGEYDGEATAARVAEVGDGVKEKIELGVIVNAPPGPEYDEEADEGE